MLGERLVAEEAQPAPDGGDARRPGRATAGCGSRTADIGEPGCHDWHVRPRFGLLGMLAGWWRVVVSSGCPLQPGGWPATRSTLIAVAAALAVAGCGGDDEKNGRTRPAAASPTARATTRRATGRDDEPRAGAGGGQQTDDGSGAAPGAAARQRTAGIAPGRGCLTGSYVSLSFEGKRSLDSPFGPIELSGRGRGLALEFSGRRWTMRGIGRRPDARQGARHQGHPEDQRLGSRRPDTGTAASVSASARPARRAP